MIGASRNRNLETTRSCQWRHRDERWPAVVSVLTTLLKTCRRDRVSLSPLDTRGQEPGVINPHAPWGHSPRGEGGECPARLSVAPHERDALHLEALVQLGGIADMRSAIVDQEPERAQRIACEFMEDRRLSQALEGDAVKGGIELGLPLAELQGTLTRLRDGALSQLAGEHPEGDRGRERSILALAVCDQLIWECDGLLSR
jgi:hypothetical protein